VYRFTTDGSATLSCLAKKSSTSPSTSRGSSRNVPSQRTVTSEEGYITKPRGQMHAMWNAGTVPGRIIEVITPGGFESYFR